jgi:geranylgeranyl pyrophosphate synthase
LLPEGRFSPWPFLTLISFQTVSGLSAYPAVNAAAGIEAMVACADLIDDVQDGDRAIETRKDASDILEVVWVLQFLAGLSVSQLANPYVSPHRTLNALSLLNARALTAMGGQHKDMASESQSKITLTESLEISALKSGTLTRCAAEVGAALGTDDDETIGFYGEFGFHLGMVGQLMNDISAVWPGGPVKSDLRLRKKTPPIVAGLEAAERGDIRARPVARFYGEQPMEHAAGSEAEVRWALWECGAIERTWTAAAVERAAARRTIERLTERVPNARLLKHLIA